MEPIFTMQYGEFAVADYLSKNIKDASIYIPASAQEKGIDLLLYRFEKDKNTTNTIQVKMSRTYYNEKCRKGFPYNSYALLYAISFIDLAILILELSLRYLFTSPNIIGTA